MEPVVRVRGLDHVVLKVADVERSLAWYTGVLGLPPERVDQWRRGEVLFPSVRIDAATVVDLLAGAPDGANVDHLCLEIEPVDLDALARSGALDVHAGPARLWGARGDGTGLFVRDPDGNVLELRWY